MHRACSQRICTRLVIKAEGCVEDRNPWSYVRIAIVRGQVSSFNVVALTLAALLSNNLRLVFIATPLEHSQIDFISNLAIAEQAGSHFSAALEILESLRNMSPRTHHRITTGNHFDGVERSRNCN